MRSITTEGPTFCRVTIAGGSSYTLFIMSKRAAAFALRRSEIGDWQHPIVRFVTNFMLDGFLVCGFQPSTGFLIAVKISREAEQRLAQGR